MGKLLTANDIINAQDLAQERVEVPEWGGDVIVRALSAYDREWWESQMMTDNVGADGKPAGTPKWNLLNGRAKLLSRALIDEDGNAIFDEVQLVKLGQKNNGVVNRLFQKAQELSGLQPLAVEDAEKNSDAAPSGDSSSDLH